MTHSHQHQAEIRQDRYGLKIAARLSEGTAALSHDLSERLRVARIQAVSKRKVYRQVVIGAVFSQGGVATLSGGDEGLSWWSRIASALPLLVLAVGLVTIHAIQNEKIANELAVVDVALLVDDLPPAAYADPGFAQFIKSGSALTP